MSASRVGDSPVEWSLAVHGGAGAMRQMDADKEAAYRRELQRAARLGAERLAAGGSALESCILAVRHMESSGVFNAGTGSCLNSEGRVEVDAAVMRASDASIGAVAAVPSLANPVDLAEAVRRHSPHCLLAGPEARAFGESVGLALEEAVPAPSKLDQYRRMLAKGGVRAAPRRAEELHRFGGTHDEGDTVGAVALDASGELALAVSTGGIWLKRPGRVGDSPLPGAGFWAEAGVGAAIATGTGEIITRSLLSRLAIEGLRRGDSAETAARAALDALAERFGRDRAGLVVLDARGRAALCFDTQGMGRTAVWSGAEEARVAVWPEEGLLVAGPGVEPIAIARTSNANG